MAVLNLRAQYHRWQTAVDGYEETERMFVELSVPPEMLLEMPGAHYLVNYPIFQTLDGRLEWTEFWPTVGFRFRERWPDPDEQPF